MTLPTALENHMSGLSCAVSSGPPPVTLQPQNVTLQTLPTRTRRRVTTKLRSVTPKSTDSSILGHLIALHSTEPPRILDSSYGRGGIWKGCPYRPTVRLDKRSLRCVDVVGDWNDQSKLFAPASFEVDVWDPPHQTDGGDRALGGDWGDRYGTADPELRGHRNINHLFGPFLEAARAVLDPRTGLLVAKIADQVHGGKLHLQADDYVAAAKADGWTVCAKIPRFSGIKPPDPKNNRQLHVRQSWSYWIAAHPGPCRAVGLVLAENCPSCGDRYAPRRRDQRTCGRARCRQWRSRRRWS